MGKNKTRAEKVATMATLIFEHLIEPRREEIKKTGALTPTQSLRHRSTRTAMQWARNLDASRWFTAAMCGEALEKVLKTHQVDLPSVPGFDQKQWCAQEAKILHKLCKRARKSTAMADPDNAETQPWLDTEDALSIVVDPQASC